MRPQQETRSPNTAKNSHFSDRPDDIRHRVPALVPWSALVLRKDFKYAARL